MRERYGFPVRCPVSGEGRRRRMGFKWVNSSVRAHGQYRFHTSEWAWEQACWHMYALEAAAGELPAHCPALVVDHNASLFLPLPKVSGGVTWGVDGRVRYDGSAVHFGSPAHVPPPSRPCFVHAAGSSKLAQLPRMSAWWASVRTTLPAGL